jgi:hypothetical protein
MKEILKFRKPLLIICSIFFVGMAIELYFAVREGSTEK